MIELYTIGFTKKTAERFFDLLSEHGVSTLVDIRLKPDSQFSGWAKRQDLPYFMRRLASGDYLYLPELAPTAEIMAIARDSRHPDRAEFERAYLALLYERNIPDTLDRGTFERGRCCLLCSENEPEGCHRLFAARRMADVWHDVTITHLM